MRIFFLSLLFLFITHTLTAQAMLTVLDSATHESIPGVVFTRGNAVVGTTDADGKCSVPVDANTPVVTHFTGYFSRSLLITSDSARTIYLQSTTPELETITITSVRNNTGIDDNPTRVEVLGQEEMNEENGIKPGNITSLLGDLSCIQLQPLSATSGETSVRIQGLDGRYTQLLRDGLPVYDGFSSGFGLLQLPPQDLKQIEVFKGPASTLYGGGAIGGMINFVSRTPSDSAEHSITGNITSLKEENVNFWTSGKSKNKFGYTFTASLNHAEAVDVNKDGFSDVPEYFAAIVHPRLFLYPSQNTNIILGVERAMEIRTGGDMLFLGGARDSLHVFNERNTNVRTTGELIVNHQFTEQFSLRLAGSYSHNNRLMIADVGSLDGTQQFGFGEISALYKTKAYDVVYGLNYYLNDFSAVNDTGAAVLTFTRNTAGAFVQLYWRIHPKVTIEFGMREDFVFRDAHFTDFFLPRIAMLWKWNDRTGLRVSGGAGYKQVNPATLVPDEHYIGVYNYGAYKDLRTERATGGSVDVYWRRLITDHMSLMMSQSFFYTEVTLPVVANADTSYFMWYLNAGRPVQTYGADSYVRLSGEEIELYVGYTWTHPQKLYDTLSLWLPNTPLHRISFTALYEPSESFRIGLEGSWTGKQYREDGTGLPSYFFGAAMVAYSYRGFTFVLNGENLFNVLQANWEQLYTGPVNKPVFKTIWAPVDGRVINFSVRYKW